MLKIENAEFAYDEKPVLRNINIEVKKGSNISILGESGCGKSTLLRLIYGLYDLDKGKIFWNGKPVLGPKFNLIPGVDEMKYLSQDFDLMPYVTVAENVGKFISNLHIEKKKNRVLELLELVEMSEFANVKANRLSKGQMQRVALAQVLAVEPELLLLDEPFSHIDGFKRNALRRNLFAYLKKRGVTCIVASHDSIDALGFADETIIIQDGMVVANGVSKDLYELPGSKYVASLFGEVNELFLSDFYPDTEDDEMVLLYSHQLIVSESGVLEVVVKDSYFKGDGYLVKAVLKDRILFFDNVDEIEKGAKLKLTLKRG